MGNEIDEKFIKNIKLQSFMYTWIIKNSQTDASCL